MTNFLQLGIQAAHAVQTKEALSWFQLAHQQDRADPVAQAWLGQTLCSLGRLLEGVQHLTQAGQRFAVRCEHGGVLDKLLEVVTQLQSWGAFEEAVSLAREAVRLQPSHAPARYLLAVTCGQINLTDEALAAAREALRLDPGQAMTQVLLASLEADARLYDEALDRLDALVAQPLGAREAFRAHKELARVLDAVGEHQEVFAHLAAADILARTLPEFQQCDAALVPRLIRENHTGYAPELLSRWAGSAFPDNPRAPVFLMGFFRSGTTLTQQVLGAHPGVFVADEASLLWSMQQSLHRMDPSAESVPSKLAKLDAQGIAALRAAYWDAARGRYGEKADLGVFIDKYTLNTVDVGLISTVFPDALVLFVKRDPRDVCLSCVMQLMVPSPATVHLLTLQGTAALYAQVTGWWNHVKPWLATPLLEFRYEDAVADFESTFRRVFAFIGLPWDPAVTQFHRRASGKFIASPSRNQVAQPLYGSSVARWQRYAGEMTAVQTVLAPFVEQMATPSGIDGATASGRPWVAYMDKSGEDRGKSPPKPPQEVSR